MLPEQKLDALLARHKMVESELATQITPATYVRLSREFAELGPVVAAIRAYRDVVGEIAGLYALIADGATDAEMRALAAEEKPALETRRAALEQEIRVALLPTDAMDERNVILEIRAGTGGDEASLFAGDLFRMYERYAARQGWKVEVISASEGTVGGYKEIIAEVQGRGAFAKLKFESGVHRVQRVPDTEGSGRIHTSAATVAVLPEAEDIDVAVNEADLRIDTMRAAAGAGRSHRINAQVGLVDRDVDVLGLRQDRNGGGRGVNAARAFRVGHALHAVHARFELELGEGAAALHFSDDLLVAADRAFARRDHLDFPTLPGCIALVHAEQVAGEQRGLIAAGPGANFQNYVALVHGVLGQERHPDLLLDGGTARFKSGLLLGGQRAHFRIGRAVRDQRVETGDLAHHIAIGPDGRDHRPELGKFA